MKTMKAIQIHSQGDHEAPRVLELPRPKPGLDEVLVRVHAAGVNPSDRNFRGWDVSGVVETKGFGVSRFIQGDEVFGYPDIARNESYAEFIVVRESDIARKPISIDHVHAASLPFAGLTAWQSLFDAANLASGQKVLIHGAAGSVGGLAVQLAKWKGAYVIGTESGRNQDFVRRLGADDVIDLEKMRFEEDVSNVDVVLDTIGGDIRKRSRSVLKKGGIFVSIIGTMPYDEGILALGVRETFVSIKSNASQLREIARLVDAGILRPMIQTVLPFSEAGHAQELSQTADLRGKVVLRVA